MDQKYLVNDVRQIIIDNQNLSYNELTYLILQKYKQQFLDENFVINVTELVSPIYYIFSPLMHVFDLNDIVNKKLLFDLNKDILVDDDDKLNCVGTGYIGTDGIMVIGMAPGFYNGNKFDVLSKPFKPSFYFAQTSKMIREGFKSYISRIYFTNLSKLVLARNLMDSKSYKQMYDKYFYILKEEINILKPKKIIALGKDVFNFLLEKDIRTETTFHPSFFIYKNQFEDGKQHYNSFIKRLMEQ